MIKGDWSDPGVVRVGEDYYSVRSTFGWQPGLAVAHSKDLVHWQYIGNGFASLPSIGTGQVAGGIWGSEIIFNPNTSMFMIYATHSGVSGFEVYESATPEGPYAAVPGGLIVDGYDPGVFVDDDGRVYLVSSAGKIVELSADGKTVVNPSVSTYAGWNEGPELFKRAPYYYVTWSSNGTERGANGIINSARSMSLAGPWEPDPTNPILQNLNNGTDPDHPFEGPQHPEVIQTQNGEWFVTFHTWENAYGTLARNMCLEPVVWTDDGWWRPKNGKKPSLTNDGPNLPYTAYEIQRSDDFSSATLGLQWFFHTTPDGSGSSWSLSENPGFLRIKTRDGDVNGVAAYQGIPMQRIDLKRFDAETAVSFDAQGGTEAAGLILHSTPAFNVTLSLTRAATGKVIELASFTNATNRNDGAGATRNVLAAVPFAPVHRRSRAGASQGQLRRARDSELLLQRRRLLVARRRRPDQRRSRRPGRSQLAPSGLVGRDDRPLRREEGRDDRKRRRLRLVHGHQPGLTSRKRRSDRSWAAEMTIERGGVRCASASNARSAAARPMPAAACTSSRSSATCHPPSAAAAARSNPRMPAKAARGSAPGFGT